MLRGAWGPRRQFSAAGLCFNSGFDIGVQPANSLRWFRVDGKGAQLYVSVLPKSPLIQAATLPRAELLRPTEGPCWPPTLNAAVCPCLPRAP